MRRTGNQAETNRDEGNPDNPERMDALVRPISRVLQPLWVDFQRKPFQELGQAERAGSRFLHPAKNSRFFQIKKLRKIRRKRVHRRRTENPPYQTAPRPWKMPTAVDRLVPLHNRDIEPWYLLNSRLSFQKSGNNPNIDIHI